MIDECSAITGIHQWHPRKSPRLRARPPAAKNTRRRNSFIPSLERLASLCERIFASRSSRILLVSDRINNHHRVRAIFLDGVPDFNVVFSVHVLGFFYSTLPPEGELTLDELHLIVRDIWLPRHDKDLEQERAKRRKGRSKTTKEVQIEELKIREAEEYRTGFGSSLWNVFANSSRL
jgi:hypothetical protein